MARQSKRDKLVEQVLKDQANADRKVRRIESNGIRIRNTSENPHVSPADIRNFSERELRQHQRDLAAFRSRQNQYLPGESNVPLQRAAVERLRAAEAANNAKAAAIEARVGGKVLPGSDTTINTSMAMRETIPVGNKMNSTTRVVQAKQTDFSGIKSQKKLEALIAKQERLNSDSGLRETVNKRFNSIRAAAGYSGNGDLLKQLEELTYEEKQFLMDYTPFGANAALNIDSGKFRADGSIQPGYSGDDEPTQDAEEMHNTLTELIQFTKANARGTIKPRR